MEVYASACTQGYGVGGWGEKEGERDTHTHVCAEYN